MPLDEVIVVQMRKGASAEYTTKPITVVGEFSIEELRDPYTASVRAVFRLSDAEVERQ